MPTSSISEPVAILSSPRIHVLENGSLFIRTVTLEDEGSYQCEASNGLGKSIGVAAFLKIHEPPKIRPMTSKSMVKRSERAEILCQASGSLPMIVEWLKNGERIATQGRRGGSNYDTREDGDSKYKLSVLTIHSTTRNDSAVFVCNAVNFYGIARSSIKVIVQEPSDPPSDLHLLQVKSQSVTISWSLPYTGNSQILGLQIEYRTATGE